MKKKHIKIDTSSKKIKRKKQKKRKEIKKHRNNKIENKEKKV